jgi:hypothetical protein
MAAGLRRALESEIRTILEQQDFFGDRVEEEAAEG